MSVTTSEILTYAQTVLGGAGANEVCLRVAVGRAYYAAYHDSKHWHSNLAVPGYLPANFAGGTHIQLRHRLQNPDTTLSAVQRRNSQKRGYQLRSLHDKRVEADYHLQTSVDMAEARQAVADAAAIIAII